MKIFNWINKDFDENLIETEIKKDRKVHYLYEVMVEKVISLKTKVQKFIDTFAFIEETKTEITEEEIPTAVQLLFRTYVEKYDTEKNERERKIIETSRIGHISILSDLFPDIDDFYDNNILVYLKYHNVENKEFFIDGNLFRELKKNFKIDNKYCL